MIHFCTKHKIFVLTNDYKIKKLLFAYKYWFVTDIPADTISKPFWKILSLGFEDYN